MIAPQKLDKGNTKMTDINEENKDLIENKIPFGLLDHETRERMMAWKHGWQVWQPEGWIHWSDVTVRSSVISGLCK